MKNRHLPAAAASEVVKMAATDSSSSNKTWELSLYELHRTPQEAITDSTEIAVSPRSLHSELMCPICLDMLKNTMTTKECLHRFCQECIITALRSGNKECPTCRKKLVSKRSLRPDPNFDMLISKIYPSRDEYEAHQERVLAKLNATHNQNNVIATIEEGMKLQVLNRAQRVRKNPLDDPNAPPNATNAEENQNPVMVLPNAVNSTNSTNATPTPTVSDTPAIVNNITAATPANLPLVLPTVAAVNNSLNPAIPPNVPTPAVTPTPPPAVTPIPTTPIPSSPTPNPTPTTTPTAPSSSNDSHQSSHQPRKRPKTTSADESAGSGAEAGQESVGEGEGGSDASVQSNEIELVFKPHPGDEDLNDGHIRYIKTTANATVDHLSRYLVMRLALDSKADEFGTQILNSETTQFVIYIASTPGQFTVLGGNMTLDQVNEKYWKVNKPLEMYFSVKK